MSKLATALAACAVAAVMPGHAYAGDVEPVLFRYDAPATCPDAEAFVKEVRARTARFQIVQSGEGLRSFEIRIGGVTGRFSGTVRVVDARGALSARTVDGERCDDVAKALALVTAISIDPKALSAPTVTAAPAGEATTAPVPSAQEAEPAPATSPAAAEAPPPKPPEARPAIASAAPQEALARQVASPPRQWQVTVGLGAFGQSLFAPGPVAGAAAYVGIAFDTGRIWSPELRLGPAVAWSGDLVVSPASVTLTWVVARADACPLRWPPRGPFAARPCVTADVGAVSASATGIPNAQSHVGPWGTVGLLALAEWLPAGPLFLDAQLSLSAVLERDWFFIAPSPTVYQAPSLVPGAALDVGVHFP